MQNTSLALYDWVLNAIMTVSLPRLDGLPLTAILLAPTYVPDLVLHKNFSDVAFHELAGKEGLRLQVTGATISDATFYSDDLVFGDPVTIGPVKFMALVKGYAEGITAASPLLGVADLIPAGGALEAQRSLFSVPAPVGGWFNLARGN